MATVLPALCFLVVNAANLSSSSVPGAGRQEVLLTLDAPAAIHLSARSPAGTSCTVIDRVRGPFASSGAVGGNNCEVDLLLDAGQYKVRVESPKRGKGQVTLSATPFTELNANPPRLTPGSGVVTTLKPRQQATYWISLKERGIPWVRISGRQAGDVRLWKNGEWLEPTQPWRQQFSPRPGQPMHEWWLDTQLEAGEYKLVVYGREGTSVTGSSIDDSLTIETGFRTGPVERSIGFTLLSVIEQAIAWKSSSASMGRTSEEPKARLGAVAGPSSLWIKRKNKRDDCWNPVVLLLTQSTIFVQVGVSA